MDVAWCGTGVATWRRKVPPVRAPLVCVYENIEWEHYVVASPLREKSSVQPPF